MGRAGGAPPEDLGRGRSPTSLPTETTMKDKRACKLFRIVISMLKYTSAIVCKLSILLGTRAGAFADNPSD